MDQIKYMYNVKKDICCIFLLCAILLFCYINMLHLCQFYVSSPIDINKCLSAYLLNISMLHLINRR